MWRSSYDIHLCAQHHCRIIVNRVSSLELASSLCFWLEAVGETCLLFRVAGILLAEDVSLFSLMEKDPLITSRSTSKILARKLQ